MAARLTYGWALLGAMVLFGLLPFQSASAVVWVFLVLAIALLPLVQPLPRASDDTGYWRGTAVECRGRECAGQCWLVHLRALPVCYVGLCLVEPGEFCVAALQRLLATLGHRTGRLALARATAGG